MDGPPILEAGKDETSFFDTCVAARSSCLYSRSILTGDHRIIQANLHIIAPDDKKMLHEGDRLSFYVPYLCSLTRVLAVSAYAISPKTGLSKPIPLQSHDPASSTCHHEVAGSVVDKVSRDGSMLAVRIVDETAPLVDGVLGTLYMEAGAINRHIITAAEGVPLYLDSPRMMDGGIYRGRIRGSTILDDDRRGVKEGSYAIFSTIESWSDHANGYEKHQRALLPDKVSARMDITLSGVDQIASELRRRFPYQVTAHNAGVYPRNTPERIRELGFADCKDYVTLFIDLLARRGVYSTAVLTSLKPAPPKSLVVPDPLWVNHVIAYVPEFDAYFDLSGEEYSLVDQASGVYGKLGLRTDTGGLVIVR